MLPIYLSIEGLYSYQQKQEIDFTTLTEAGLFGIFGAVGSGKSSILEAISFALYGETERLNKQEKRSYNMMNLKSNTASIVFDFLNFENKKLRFTVQWKRKKKFEDTSTFERQAYEWKNEEWIPLPSSEGDLVTHLSYANFRRTIIIPQGQFKEFLELKGKDRSEMMKEIFNLNQYDLGPKVTYLQAENNRKLEHIKGVLSGFEEVNEELIVQKQQEFADSTRVLSQLKEDYLQLESVYKKLTDAFENKKNLEAKESELQRLSAQRSQIEQLEKDVNEYETALHNFKDPINNLHIYTANKETLLHKIEKLKESKATLQENILKLESAHNAIKTDYEKLDFWRKEVDDYRLLVINLDLLKKKNETLHRIEKGKPIVDEVQQKEQQLLQKLKAEEEQLDSLKLNTIDTTEILALENWYQKADLFHNKQNELENRLLTNIAETKQLQNIFSHHQVSELDWKDQLELRKAEIQNAVRNLTDKESQYQIKKEWSKHLLRLQDGEACPLCGSLDHPAPMQTEDISAEEILLEAERTRIEQVEEENNQIFQELIKASTSLADKTETIKAIKNEIAALVLENELHRQAFAWKEFSPENKEAFETKKATIQLLESSIKQTEINLKKTREELQLTQENAVKFQKSLDGLLNQVQVFDANITQNSQQLKVLDMSLFVNESIESLQAKSVEKLNNIHITEQQFNSLTDELYKNKNTFASTVGQYTEAHEQYIQLSGQLQNLQNTINALLRKYEYEDIIVVKKILEKQLDTNQLRQRIQDYHVAVSTLQQVIAQLQEKNAQIFFSEELFRETQEQFNRKKTELEEQFTVYGALEKELSRLRTEMEKKGYLLQDYEQLNTRKDNLSLLFNLFKGNGFVNYVSSIHLQRLCEIANQRFHRLTKNQLSLYINESNEFEVIDFLNNGNRRSVKTLSGGQIFQASLCLALALAESIQSMNKADRNFFFIDEGFGTQDQESMNTVFDTLQYLHQENRIVGIISHVEELKERMPRAITVIKDLDKGSIVNAVIN